MSKQHKWHHHSNWLSRLMLVHPKYNPGARSTKYIMRTQLLYISNWLLSSSFPSRYQYPTFQAFKNTFGPYSRPAWGFSSHSSAARSFATYHQRPHISTMAKRCKREKTTHRFFSELSNFVPIQTTRLRFVFGGFGGLSLRVWGGSACPRFSPVSVSVSIFGNIHGWS